MKIFIVSTIVTLLIQKKKRKEKKDFALCFVVLLGHMYVHSCN